MDVVFSGQITAVLPMNQGTSQRTGQPWYSQSYLLCYEQGQYPKSVTFSVFGQEKIQQFAIKQGEQLTVHLNIEAKQGQKGYFNDVSCWKVERQPVGGYQQPQYQPQPIPQHGYQPAPQYQQPMQQQTPFPPQQPAPQPTPQPQGQQQGLPFPPAQ